MRLVYRITLLIAVILLACLCPAHAQIRAIPPHPFSGYKPSEPIKKVEQPSRYQRLLDKYLACIVDMDQKRKQIIMNGPGRGSYVIETYRIDVEKDEAELLAKLRKIADKERRGKLEFDGECLESQVLYSPSAAAARIFATLLKENRVDASAVVSSLYRRAYNLRPEWIQIAKDIYAKSSPGSRDRRWAALVLYRTGVSRETYIPELAQLAVEKNDDWALKTLFFDKDPVNGEERLNRSTLNADLMVKLIGNKSAPEIRVVCAEYAAATGMNGLAEAACADLLSQKYKGQNVDGPTPEEDYPLARAKASALYLMFYTVKSELGFKQIYDLSRIPEEEMINGDKGLMPKGWVCTSFYTLAKMDIDSARGLISEVERYNTAHKW